MKDKIFEAFLRVQYEEAMALAAASDIVSVLPLDDLPPQCYAARFDCRGLIKIPGGEVEEVSRVFETLIYLPSDYLWTPSPEGQGAGDGNGRSAPVRPSGPVVNVISPRSVFHPNVSWPYICIGRMQAGTSLVDIIAQVFEILGYQKWTAHDGLNEAACEWARAHQDRFPIDRRPLKRRVS